MKFFSLQIFEIDLNLFRLWFDQGSTHGDFRLHGTVSARSGFMAVGFKEIWMAWISWYRFTQVNLSNPLDRDRTHKIKTKRERVPRVRFPAGVRQRGV
jgi:hypothetical protein